MTHVRHDTTPEGDLALIRLQAHRHAAFSHGDRESMRLMAALHRHPRMSTRLGLALLAGPSPLGRLVERARPASADCRSRCAELIEAVTEFLEGDVVSFAATVNSEVDWAVVGVRRRVDTVFVTVRSSGHPAIPEQAGFLRDFETVCPDHLLTPRVVRSGETGGWAMLALTNLDPPLRAPRIKFEDLLAHLRDIRATGFRDVTYAEVADELAAAGALAKPLERLLRASGDEDRRITLCRAHGDFVPWNMTLDGPNLYLWDWSRAMRSAPWPFDAIHFCFQRRRHERHQTRDTALAGTLSDISALANHLGIDSNEASVRRAVALYAAFRHAHEERVQLTGSDTLWLAENAI